jgi:hypothetical protein
MSRYTKRIEQKTQKKTGCKDARWIIKNKKPLSREKVSKSINIIDGSKVSINSYEEKGSSATYANNATIANNDNDSIRSINSGDTCESFG